MSIPSGRNFASCYTELCKQQRLRPLPVICVTLPHSLDFTTDRVKMDDWGPILNSLSLDLCLKSISVRSRYQCRKPLEEINSEDKARSVSKAPVVLTRYLLEWLSHSLGQCVRNSSNLSNLELEGIPLPNDCIAALCIGLAATETLSHLSLQRCHIGDNGCELICRTITSVQSIRTLNLSQCDLTAECTPHLAGALRRQKLLLYHEAWKRSLRYREPDLEAMPGLRRLTLNDNPGLGDLGMIELIEAIGDSLWLKALDVQHCGLTDRIGESLLQLLDNNNTLTVLDVRQNSELNEELVDEVIRRLRENNAEGKMEYRWLGVPRKQQRVGSAGAKGENRRDHEGRGQERPRSAIVRGRRKPCQVVVPRKLGCATKEPSGSSALEQTTRESNARRVRDPAQTKPKSRMSLHLDLQSQIRPVIGDRLGQEASRVERIGALKSEAKRADVGTQIVENRESGEESNDLRDILSRLEETRREYVSLLEESKRSNVALAEEQARRERAEENLRILKENLAKLEDVSRDKDAESRGFLLLSQESVEEICVSFDRLLKMLENATRGSALEAKESSEVALVGADIRRRVASAIRKTKSERFRRGYVAQPQGSSKCAEFSRKLAKSESDVRTHLPPASRALLERSMGDGRDILSRMLMEGDLENEEDASRVLLEKNIGDGREVLSRTPVDGNVRDDYNVSREHVEREVERDQDKSRAFLERNIGDGRDVLSRMLVESNLKKDEDLSKVMLEKSMGDDQNMFCRMLVDKNTKDVGDNVQNHQDEPRMHFKKNMNDNRNVLCKMLIQENLVSNENVSRMLEEKHVENGEDISRILFDKNMVGGQALLSRILMEKNVEDGQNTSRAYMEKGVKNSQDVSTVHLENDVDDNRDMLSRMIMEDGLENDDDISKVLLKNINDAREVSRVLLEKNMCDGRDVLSRKLVERKMNDGQNVSKVHTEKSIDNDRDVLSGVKLENNASDRRNVLSKTLLKRQVDDSTDRLIKKNVENSREALSKVLAERKLEDNVNVLSKMLLKGDIKDVQSILSKMLMKRNLDDDRDVLSKVLLERHVDDGREDVETQPVQRSLRRDTVKVTSPREKAREIFAKIVNCETTLDFSSNVD
ncbi:hypothetical protein KM043_004651 [Ampulex compressa]|nr:hypothetical protein KM043_004651 [Ampulex compressa]